MRVLISGASGMIGRALATALTAAGHDVARLVRARPRDGSEYRWDPASDVLDPAAVPSCDAVVHLAGAGIAGGRWTGARKTLILESRRTGTRLVAGAIAGASPRPGVLVSASAIGFYGDRGDEMLTEASSPGGGFLAGVVRSWEAETAVAGAAGTRVVLLRSGLVLDRSGGALPRLALPFRLGLGGPVGSGRQWMSWITLVDLVRVILHALARGGLSGPVNAVAPGAVPNREFGRTLGRVLRRPAVLPLPAWAVRLGLGEMGRELLLFSQRVTPARLLEEGFAWRHPALEGALRNALSGRVGAPD